MKPGPDMWNRRYSEEGYAYGQEPNDFLREMSDRLPAGPALCLAAGEGRNAVYLAGLAQINGVTAVDASSAGMDKARALAATKGVNIEAIAADLAAYDLGENHWGTITSVFAHMPPPIRESLHRRVVQALKPGGVLVLEAYTPAQVGRGTGGPPIAELTMTLEALRSELFGLDFVVGREQEREVHEGRFHNGLASVVQVLAVKPAG